MKNITKVIFASLLVNLVVASSGFCMEKSCFASDPLDLMLLSSDKLKKQEELKEDKK